MTDHQLVSLTVGNLYITHENLENSRKQTQVLYQKLLKTKHFSNTSFVDRNITESSRYFIREIIIVFEAKSQLKLKMGFTIFATDFDHKSSRYLFFKYCGDIISDFANLPNMADRGGTFSFFQDIHITNGLYLNFHKTHDHQIWAADTSRGVDSLETN